MNDVDSVDDTVDRGDDGGDDRGDDGIDEEGDPPTPVTVIGGYLGAGKTTIVNHLLRSADERIAVLVNDFGDVNIDAELIESAEGDTISLTNGCICCSLVDGFDAAIRTVLGGASVPERIVVEASGVAIPSQIAAHAHRPGLLLDGVLVVVDAENALRQSRDEYIGDVIEHQVRSADLLLLSKVDLVDDARRRRLEDWLDATTDVPIVEARNGEVDLEVLVGLGGRHRPPHRAETPVVSHEATTRTESWTDPLDRADLERWLDALGPDVVRVKGVVRLTDTPDRRHVVHRVGRRRSIVEAGPWNRERSELVVISVASS